MAHEIAFASIRQGDLTAAEAWNLISPFMDTDDRSIALRLSEALRGWVWKALDRRRRDASLRAWIDLLNRVEGFLSERFETVAARIEVLAELLHESITVADMANPSDLLRRRHVKSILMTLAREQGEWMERASLMDELGLKPANTTRLIALLIDIGWVEQEINGREATYRLSVDGMAQACGLGDVAVPGPVVRVHGQDSWRRSPGVAAAYNTRITDAQHLDLGGYYKQHREWEHVMGDIADALDVDHHDEIEQDEIFALPTAQLVLVRASR